MYLAKESCRRSTKDWVIPGHGETWTVSSVAVYNAKGDDDGHAEEHGDGKYQPAVFELARDDATEEDRTWTRVVVVIAAASTSAPASHRTLTAAAAP